MSLDTNEQLRPAHSVPLLTTLQVHTASAHERVSWILPLACDSYVSERSPRHPQRFWKKMSQLEQFGLSEGGVPLLCRNAHEMIP